ncbi:MAG: patatin-like phospholipase family protein [Acidimicrobiia bacterium]|nr:patatin-like phospholipase family protein [Acidimicrobiia bacterium]
MTDEGPAAFLRGISGFEDFDAETLAALDASLERATLRGGERLFAAGDEPDGLVITVRGRLGVLDAEGEIVATLGRHQIVGEIGALAGLPRTTEVIALRDTEILRLDQASFDRLFSERPELGRSLSRLVVTRLVDHGEAPREQGVPAAVAVVTIDGGIPIDDVVAALVRSAADCAVVRAADVAGRSDTEALSYLDRIEAEHDLVVLVAGHALTRDEWFDRCVRQADSVVVVVPPTGAGSWRGPAHELGVALHESRANVEVAIDNPSHVTLGPSAAEWTRLLSADRFHHLRHGDRAVADRFARLTTGKGVGLVFSGGAAKGLAHLGAWRAMKELGQEIDTVAGVSLGALLAAGVALDYEPDLLRKEVDDRLVRQKGLADLTFPWVSLLRGEEISRRIRAVGRGRVFEQAWRPFVCTSCDLSTGETVEHRSGLLWKAIRASLSIPGLFPPVRDGDRLLVDGAVRDNLPIANLRGAHPTPLRVIAIDVGKEGFLDPGTTPERGHVSGWSLLAQRLNPRRADPDIPTMAQVLMRVVDLAGIDHGAEPDVLIRPDLRSLGLGEFTQIDAFEQAGYDATIAALG